jgi:asparagine synthase (glutamine-hydrolysing)
MSEVMAHREWFVVESFVDDEQVAAIGRIGIGIFNQAPQPVWNSSRNVALVMAGELYNRDALGSSASETAEQIALALYERQGEQFACHLNGAFIIGVYDKGRNRLVLTNDRFGLYQLFYAIHTGRLIFAPEMKGILCDEGFRRKIDLTALAQYVRFQHLLGERTFFEDIHLLPGASVLTYDISTGSHSIQQYWSFGDIPHQPRVSFEEAAEETGRLLRSAIRRLSGDSHRLGVYLSGGLDSRIILGMIERRPVDSLTYGRRDCRDVYYAGKIAKAVGSDHHWIDLPDGKWVEQYADFHMDVTEGYHSWIHAHGISTLAQARQRMDVNLTGWGGGMLKGPPRNLEPLQIYVKDNLALISRIFKELNQDYTWPSLTEGEEKLLYCGSLQKEMDGLAFDSFQTEFAPYLDYRTDVRGEYFYIYNHDRRLTQNFVIFTRSHVEVRMPFYDYDFFDFVHSIPTEIRGHQKLYRRIIQRETPRLARIPYDHDEFLPTTQPIVRLVHAESVKLKRRINRHVRKIFTELHPLYADYDEYLRGDLRSWAENILYDRRTAERGIFEPKFLSSLMQRSLANHGEWMIGKIAPLMTYEMMLRRYYDNGGRSPFSTHAKRIIR